MNAHSEPALVEFIRYNNWANQMVLKACQSLSEAQLATHIPGAYGTIGKTLDHIFRAEAAYVRLLTGNYPQPAFKWEKGPSLAELSAYSMQVGDVLLDTAQRVSTSSKITIETDGKELHFQALALFIQIIDHGIEHRTNITTMLNQGLQTPPEIDGWGYLQAHLDRFELK
jgi:uncharacterized damage-inducible protein DinB